MIRRKNGRRRLGSGIERLESRVMLDGDPTVPHDHLPDYDPATDFHIHAQLEIWVNGSEVTIPEGVGDTVGIHTHDGTGELHIHPNVTNPGSNSDFVRLGDFFDAWLTDPDPLDQNVNAVLRSTNLFDNFVDDTHSLQMFVNGKRTTDFQNYQIHEGDRMILVYGNNPVVAMNTNFGSVVMEVYANANGDHPATPQTAENFFNYAEDGDYDNAFFHRLVPGFVLQGLGFKTSSTTLNDQTQISSVPTDPPVQNEFENFVLASGTDASVTTGIAIINLDSGTDLSNVSIGDRIQLFSRTDGDQATGGSGFTITAVDDANDTVTVDIVPSGASQTTGQWQIFPLVNIRGTVSLAKLGGLPSSGTSQPFFNLADNTKNLDFQNGGFTPFAHVLDMGPVDDMAAITGRASTTAANNGIALTDVPVSDDELIVVESIVGGGTNSLSGFAYVDTNNDGIFGPNESPLDSVTVRLIGEDDLGHQINLAVLTAGDGSYRFTNLRPGSYMIVEEQPQFMVDGMDTIGSAGGDASVNDKFTIQLGDGTQGTDYNFGERGRTAEFASLFEYIMGRDELANFSTRFNDSILAATSPTEGQVWSALGAGWSDFLSVNLEISADELTLTLSAMNSSAEVSTAELLMIDPRVTVLGRVGDILVIRLDGNSSDFFP